MTLLQIIFIISGLVLIIIAADFFIKKKLNLFNIIIMCVAGILLPIFVIFPETLDTLWGFFWIVSGADLLIYCSIIFLFYICITLTNKVWDLKIHMTEMVREIALQNSKQKILHGEIAFIVPAYNEGWKIKEVITDIVAAGYSNIIAINDGSADDTLSHLKSLEDLHRSLIVLNHFKNRGQGASLETGFEYIRRYWDIDYIVTFDSDGQHKIEDLPLFIKTLKDDKELELAIWSRFLKWGKTNASFIRKCILKLGIWFTYMTTWARFTDTHNGYRVLTRKSLDTIKITMDRMSHASEILWIIAKKKLAYKEVPVFIEYTEYSVAGGQSSSNAIGIAMRVIWDKLFR